MSELEIALLGAAVGGVIGIIGALVGALFGHFLSLRLERPNLKVEVWREAIPPHVAPLLAVRIKATGKKPTKVMAAYIEVVVGDRRYPDELPLHEVFYLRVFLEEGTTRLRFPHTFHYHDTVTGSIPLGEIEKELKDRGFDSAEAVLHLCDRNSGRIYKSNTVTLYAPVQNATE